MRKRLPTARRNVISVRVSDEDLQAIKYMSEKINITLSDLIREALAQRDLVHLSVKEGDASALMS